MNTAESMKTIIETLQLPVGHIQESIFANDTRLIKIFCAETNQPFSKTKYFYDNRTIIHFTSLKALNSIIQEKAIRLYNLNNASDLKEYSFLANNFKNYQQLFGYSEGYFKELFNDVKDRYFILSATKPNNIDSEKHWKKYACNGNGVAIELEILNDALDWDGFHLSPVYYSQPNQIEEIVNRLIVFYYENPKSKSQLFIDPVLCLNKRPQKRFQEEDEIRLLAHRPGMYGFGFDALVQNDIGKDSKSLVKYFSLPLICANSQNNFEDLIADYNQYNSIKNNPISQYDIQQCLLRAPLIRIKRVLFHHSNNTSSNELNRTIEELKENAYYKLGYELSFETNTNY